MLRVEMLSTGDEVLHGRKLLIPTPHGWRTTCSSRGADERA